jgi:hypothetical protein
MGHHAKRLGGTVLRILLQTRLGALCAASLAAGCSGLVTLGTKAVFLGQLSPSESSQLSERFLKYALMKMPMLLLLASSSPRYGDITQWLAWTAVMCWFSMFVRLASLRGDALLCSPAAGAPACHARILALLLGILAQDCSWIASYCRTLGDGSASHALLWLFDAVHVALDAAFCLCKYATHAVDHWRAAQAEARGQEAEHWEGQSTLIYYIDLLSSLSLETLTLLHSLHVWWLHGVQMQLVDGALLLEVRYMLGALQQRVAGHARYRRLQRTLMHSFPEAAPGRLAGELCPICLDGMRAGKQLPCSHCVHASCLLAWLQQQSSGGDSKFTCPMCRADLDVQPPPSKHHSPLRSLGLTARGLLHTAVELLAAAGQPSPRQGSPAPGSRAALHSSRPSPARRAAHARADSRAAAPAAESAAAVGGMDAAPTRRVTRLQARLAAAQAAAAPPPSRGPGRVRRRIDGMLD